jgi:hypothetical protein
MDVATAVATAFGLAGAAGLNAWLPVVAAAVLDRTGVVDLAAPFDQLSTTPALVILGVVFIADFVGDKIPAVDSVLHAIGSVVAPAAGAVLFTGQTGAETDLPTAAAILLGAVTAGSVHLGRATLRPASTVTTAGVGNPVLSLGEDAGSGLLVLAAFMVPLLAFAVTIALIAAVVVGWRRLRRGGRSAGYQRRG